MQAGSYYSIFLVVSLRLHLLKIYRAFLVGLTTRDKLVVKNFYSYTAIKNL